MRCFSVFAVLQLLRLNYSVQTLLFQQLCQSFQFLSIRMADLDRLAIEYFQLQLSHTSPVVFDGK